MKAKIMLAVIEVIAQETFYDDTTIKLSQFDGPDTFECEINLISQKILIRCREDENGISINIIKNNKVVASRGYNSRFCNKNKISEELETVLRWVID